MRCIHPLVLILAATSLGAQQPAAPAQTWVQALGAQTVQHNGPCLQNQLGAGAGLGQWVSARWGWEVSVLDVILTDKAGLWSAHETHGDISALYGLRAQPGAWRPFLRAGAGGTELQSPLSLTGSASTRVNLMGGVGVQVTFPEGGMVSLEARSTSIRSAEPRTEFQLLLGVGGHWGGRP